MYFFLTYLLHNCLIDLRHKLFTVVLLPTHYPLLATSSLKTSENIWFFLVFSGGIERERSVV